MMVYLRHPAHGYKIAYENREVEDDIKHGWEKYQPEPKKIEKVISPVPAIEESILEKAEMKSQCPDCLGIYKNVGAHKRFCKGKLNGNSE